MPQTHQIYEGVWVNWARGPVYGRTLTLSQQNSGLLLAFIAILVAFAGGQFWKLIAFYLHRFYTRRHQPKDGLQLQIEVTLRNTTEPFSAAKTFIVLGSRWYGRAPQAILRSLPLATLAIGSFATFSVIGIFSSLVAQGMDNKMLISNGRCGYHQLSLGSGFYIDMMKERQYQVNADTYVRQCYGNDTDAVACSTFVTQQISFTTDTNASCPFAPGMCIGGDTAAISFDTGLLDSNDIFGINGQDMDRIQFRWRTTCAPLDLDYHVRANVRANVTIGALHLEDTRYQLFLGNNSAIPPTLGITNVTYWISEMSMVDSKFAYQVGAIFSNSMLAGDWTPIPELNRTDADISIVFLSQNGVFYLSPVDDPFFAAHQPFQDWTNETFYSPDHAISAVACADQYQLCTNYPSNGSSQLCGGPLNSKFGTVETMTRLQVNNMIQVAAIPRLFNASFWAQIYQSVNGRGASALRATDLMDGELQVHNLSSTQWHDETTAWFEMGLARMQQEMVDYADNEPNADITPPKTPEEILGCSTQIIGDNSGQYQNFSVLGLAIAIAFALLIILLSIIVKPLHHFVDGRTALGYTAMEERQAQGLFQLLMFAVQGTGFVGTWIGKDKEVPVTFGNETIPGVRHFKQNAESSYVRKSRVSF